MNVHITHSDGLMRGMTSGHTAARTAAGWTVSWLPGHTWTRGQALTALAIAERVAARPRLGNPGWLQIESWLAELDLEPRALDCLYPNDPEK